jgi:nitrate reductase NapE component
MFPFDEEVLSTLVLLVQLYTLAAAAFIVAIGFYIYNKRR